jgi:hypothetical protein
LKLRKSHNIIKTKQNKTKQNKTRSHKQMRDFIFWAGGLTAMRIMINIDSYEGGIFVSALVYIITRCLAGIVQSYIDKKKDMGTLS